MELTSFKLGIYDVLGLVLPGFISICEIWVTLTGWHSFANDFGKLNGVEFSALLILSFGAGHLIQEVGDVVLKRIHGPRFFKRERDMLWATDEADAIKSAIWNKINVVVESVDVAFDICLTAVQNRLALRESFLATSDLARSFLVLSCFGLASAVKLSLDGSMKLSRFELLVLSSAALFCVGFLAWKRMLRFRKLSEEIVFRAYLGAVGSGTELQNGPSGSSASEE